MRALYKDFCFFSRPHHVKDNVKESFKASLKHKLMASFKLKPPIYCKYLTLRKKERKNTD